MNGEASFDFRVGMQPGNNYRVVASVIDESMYSGVQTDNPAGAKYLGPELRQTGSAPASPLLTVWRRLWVENDSMEKIPQDPPDTGEKENDLSSDLSSRTLINVMRNEAGTTTFFRIPAVSDESSL